MPNQNVSQIPENSSESAAEIARLREELARLEEKLATTERIYAHFVPQQLLNFLNVHNIRDVRLGMQTERRMTVVFADIRDFTSQSESMTPQENFNFLNSFLSQMEPVIGLHKGVIDKFIGDAIMALFPDRPDDALLAALGMQERLETYNQGRARAGYSPTRIGIGINTGIVMLGTVGGANRMEGTVISDSVNVAARLEGLTKNYGTSLLISEHTLHSLHNPENFLIRFIDRVCVRGKHEPQSIYEVYDGDGATLRLAKKHTQRMFEEALAYYHLRDIPHARARLMDCLDAATGDLPARVYLEHCDEYMRSGRYIGESDGELAPPWSDDYGVGNIDDDAERRTLLSQLGNLASNTRTSNFDSIEATLQHIETNARRHFAQQELLMQQIAYPFAREHAQQHQRLLLNLAAVKQRIEAGLDDPVHLAFHIKLSLCDFLINHSLKFDRHLYQFKRMHDSR